MAYASPGLTGVTGLADRATEFLKSCPSTARQRPLVTSAHICSSCSSESGERGATIENCDISSSLSSSPTSMTTSSDGAPVDSKKSVPYSYIRSDSDEKEEMEGDGERIDGARPRLTRGGLRWFVKERRAGGARRVKVEMEVDAEAANGSSSSSSYMSNVETKAIRRDAGDGEAVGGGGKAPEGGGVRGEAPRRDEERGSGVMPMKLNTPSTELRLPAVGVVGVDGSNSASTTGEREGFMGVDIADDGGEGKRSSVGETICSK